MDRRAFALAGIVFLSSGWAQDSPKLEFDAATIRPSFPDRRNGTGESGGPGTADPTRIRYSFFTLPLLLMSAYDVIGYQISVPPGMDTGQRYDVVANVPPGATKQQAREMLQNFLIDRFQLKLHREIRILPLYELVTGKSGFKLTPQPDAIPAKGGPKLEDGEIAVGMGKDRLHMYAQRVTMKGLTRVLSDDLATPVVDKTGIAGEYDFNFEYSREGLGGTLRTPETTDGSDAPTLQVAIQEALGLRLEAKKGPIDTVVIDAAAKSPAAN
jgi:uncharacterized protein (TIGR03435 family)